MVGKPRVELRRGWLRNQRAVSVGQAGLLIEPWIGQVRAVPWADLRGARWRTPDQVRLATVRGTLTLSASPDRLNALLAAVAEAVARQRARGLAAADVERWLSGRHSFQATPRVPGGGFDTLGCLGANEVAIGCTIPLYCAIAGAVALCRAWHWTPWLVPLVAYALGFLLFPLGALALEWLNGELQPPHRIDADAERCSIRVGAQCWEPFDWRDVAEVQVTSSRVTVWLANGDHLTYAPATRLDAVTRALTAAATLRRPFVIEAAERGLSPAEQPGASADRGLSRP